MENSTVSIGQALRERWWLVVDTPFVTGVLAIIFVFVVTPVFEARGSVRFLENAGGPLGGALSAIGGDGGGLGLLAGLTGQGVPISTEMAVMKSRTIAGEIVDKLGLRMEIAEPGRVRRSSLFSLVEIGPDAGEWVVTLEPAGDRQFRVTGEVLISRDPFKPVLNETREVRDLGTVSVGGTLPLAGARIVLGEGAASRELIEFELLPREVAIDGVLDGLVVARPERDADLVEVLFQWVDPEIATAGVNELTRRFVEMRDTLQATEAGLSARFISKQLDSVSGELSRAEDELRRYSELNGVVAPEAQAEAGVQQLAEVQIRRDGLSVDQAALGQLLTEIESGVVATPDGESPYRRLIFYPTLLQNTATAELLSLLGELENDRALLRQTRTDESREITVLNRRIADLEAQLQSVARTYLSGLGDQISALDQTLTGYQAELSRVPRVQMGYLRRRRDVEVQTEIYVFMRASLKEAEVRAAGQAGGVRVLDVAVEPIEPIRPKPMITGLLALVIGGLLGVGGAIVLGHAAAGPVSDESAATEPA